MTGISDAQVNELLQRGLSSHTGKLVLFLKELSVNLNYSASNSNYPMFQYRLTNQITGTVEQVHFNKKMYDTTDGRYNTGVFIATEPGYYQFTCALSSESSAKAINYYLQRNRSTVASGMGR